MRTALASGVVPAGNTYPPCSLRPVPARGEVEVFTSPPTEPDFPRADTGDVMAAIRRAKVAVWSGRSTRIVPMLEADLAKLEEQARDENLTAEGLRRLDFAAGFIPRIHRALRENPVLPLLALEGPDVGDIVDRVQRRPVSDGPPTVEVAPLLEGVLADPHLPAIFRSRVELPKPRRPSHRAPGPPRFSVPPRTHR